MREQAGASCYAVVMPVVMLVVIGSCVLVAIPAAMLVVCQLPMTGVCQLLYRRRGAGIINFVKGLIVSKTGISSHITPSFTENALLIYKVQSPMAAGSNPGKAPSN